MTMHLLGPQFNNIGRTRKKPSARLLKAKAEHEQYLRSMGLHLEQLAAKPKTAPKKLKPSVTVDRSGPPCSNGFAAGGAKKSVFDSKWQRTYEDDPAMAEREQLALAEAEAKKSRICQTYNKGPVMYSGSLKASDFGKRR